MWKEPLVDFVFDSAKSEINKAKHGIDFDEAQALWSDSLLLEGPARSEGEPRFIAIGMIGEKCWSAIFTRRGDKLRIISVRRARRPEVERYESR